MSLKPVAPLDLSRLKVLPLSERHSLTRCEDILLAPDAPAPALAEGLLEQIATAATAVEAARNRGASVMLIYGAHLLRNGAAPILDALMAGGWLTHIATNGAGTIHDWEYAWLGRSTEGVESNVAKGTFGCVGGRAYFPDLAITGPQARLDLTGEIDLQASTLNFEGDFSLPRKGGFNPLDLLNLNRALISLTKIKLKGPISKPETSAIPTLKDIIKPQKDSKLGKIPDGIQE